MSQREADIYTCRVYLREAARRRATPFWHVLMSWAANARCRASKGQRELLL